MENLLADTIARARLWLAEYRYPAILWSGGKDSTVLLHILIHHLGVRLPCIQWREPRFRHRYAYSDRLIADWNLEVHDYPPFTISIASGPDSTTGHLRFDAVKQYQIGPAKTAAMCLGTEAPTEAELSSGRYLCGLKDLLQRPTGHFNFPWDAVFHGHKSSDTDLIKGHIPLASHIHSAPGQATALFLLRDWSDQDIFDYLEAHSIPIDSTRYIRTPDGWINNPDKSNNADFYPVCWNCVNRHAGPAVHCPRLQSTVNNISHLAPYIDLSIPEQGVHHTWNSIANPAEPAAPTNGHGPSSGETAPTPPESLPNTSAPTIRCSKPHPADAASPSGARSAEESPAQSTNHARMPAGHSSQAVHSA